MLTESALPGDLAANFSRPYPRFVAGRKTVALIRRPKWEEEAMSPFLKVDPFESPPLIQWQ